VLSQQVVAYAVEMNVPNAFLVYPSTAVQSIDAKVGKSILVRSLIYDITGDLEEAGKQFHSNVLLSV
jgi:hypothetical protein